MFGQAFPIADYYSGAVLDATTISRTGSWWLAVLLLKDPKTGDPHISIYRWQKVGQEWKTRSKLTIRDKGTLAKVTEQLARLGEQLPDKKSVELE